MNGTVLVIVRAADELELARAFVSALGDVRCFLLFGLEDLRTRFGETEHATSVDIATFFVNPGDISLAVCFSGARELSASSNLLLLGYLNEVGIATVEIQRDLLQDCARAAEDSAARHFLRWSGSDGIGSLRSALPRPGGAFVRDDVVLVSSRLDGRVYSEEERHRFAFAVMRLARENPTSCFMWRPSTTETQQADLAPYWEMLDKLGPANLFIEENETFAALLARSSAVISMASNLLFDCAEARKATLVFVGDASATLPGIEAKTFRSYAELAPEWSALRAQPSAFFIRSELPALDGPALRRRVDALAASSQRMNDWLPVALRYLGYWQEARGRAELGRIHGGLTNLDKRLASAAERSEKLADGIDKLERSSVAYKATKLMARVRKRAKALKR